MTMLMAAYHPQRFTAASAWVGISDLREWHAFHARTQVKGKYAVMLEACTGGPPGHSDRVDEEYLSRSPIHHLQKAAELPLDLNAGITDGKTGSVPIMQTLNAFNVLAQARRTPPISPAEIDQLWTNGKLTTPLASDNAEGGVAQVAALGYLGASGTGGSRGDDSRRRTSSGCAAPVGSKATQPVPPRLIIGEMTGKCS